MILTLKSRLNIIQVGVGKLQEICSSPLFFVLSLQLKKLLTELISLIFMLRHIFTGDHRVVVASFTILISPRAGLRVVREGALRVTRSTLVANLLAGATCKVAVTFAAESLS